MSVVKIARDAGNVFMYRATWGGSQNFLGARWVERLVDNSPAAAREQVALRFLSLSPHYFYDRDVHGEDTRNRKSRQALADQLIAPHLTPESRVLDYGCGPGYLAAAVARTAAHVTAVDISRGVLACARAINGQPNITFSTPDEFRATGEQVALRFLSLSPHYFYDRDVHGEDTRNRKSRQSLADQLIAPHLTPDSRVLDYGCGPGYLAAAVARTAAHVTAVDISRGVLACARAINGQPNITFSTPDEFRATGEQVDLAYSFAVIQHLRTEVLRDVLGRLAAAVRPGGTLLLHFAVPDEEQWRTEDQWRADESLANRAKLRYALNCFGRSASEMSGLVAGSGFTEVTVRSLSGDITVPGDTDIPHQHLLTARRK